VVGGVIAVPVVCAAAGAALVTLTLAAPVYGVYRLVRHLRGSSPTSDDDDDDDSSIDHDFGRVIQQLYIDGLLDLDRLDGMPVGTLTHIESSDDDSDELPPPLPPRQSPLPPRQSTRRLPDIPSPPLDDAVSSPQLTEDMEVTTHATYGSSRSDFHDPSVLDDFGSMIDRLCRGGILDLDRLDGIPEPHTESSDDDSEELPPPLPPRQSRRRFSGILSPPLDDVTGSHQLTEDMEVVKAVDDHDELPPPLPARQSRRRMSSILSPPLDDATGSHQMMEDMEVTTNEYEKLWLLPSRPLPARPSPGQRLPDIPLPSFDESIQNQQMDHVEINAAVDSDEPLSSPPLPRRQPTYNRRAIFLDRSVTAATGEVTHL